MHILEPSAMVPLLHRWKDPIQMVQKLYIYKMNNSKRFKAVKPPTVQITSRDMKADIFRGSVELGSLQPL